MSKINKAYRVAVPPQSSTRVSPRLPTGAHVGHANDLSVTRHKPRRNVTGKLVQIGHGRSRSGTNVGKSAATDFARWNLKPRAGKLVENSREARRAVRTGAFRVGRQAREALPNAKTAGIGAGVVGGLTGTGYAVGRRDRKPAIAKNDGLFGAGRVDTPLISHTGVFAASNTRGSNLTRS